MLHTGENPDWWKFRLCKKEIKWKKDNLYIFSDPASKWKSLFWTAILLDNMEKGEKNFSLVSKGFVVETGFYFLFRKNCSWPFFQYG